MVYLSRFFMEGKKCKAKKLFVVKSNIFDHSSFMLSMRIYAFLFLFACITSTQAQILGGEHVFEFLRLSQNPHVTALGGVAISCPANDVMMSTSNPSLLRPSFHTSLGLNYNLYYAGTKVSNLFYAQHIKTLNTTVGLGIQYLNYGSFQLTDNIGNQYGDAKATDYAISLSASKSYLTRWRYGATLKLANSTLIDKKASALLADIGVAYADTINLWYAGAVIKNAGVVIKNYEAGVNQPLPIDLQIGVTKKFKKAPFSIMVLAHHLQTWNIRYDNPVDQVNNQLLFTDSNNTKTKTYFADKLFRHFVFALDINLGKRLEISAGYNHMRRAELAISEKKAMSGFSYGIGLYLNKFIIHVAQSHYHIAGASTEIGLAFRLNQLIGGGNHINWSEKFANSYQ